MTIRRTYPPDPAIIADERARLRLERAESARLRLERTESERCAPAMTIDETRPLAAAWLAWYRDPSSLDYPLSGEKHQAMLTSVHERMMFYVGLSADELFPDGLWDRESMAEWIAYDLFEDDSPEFARDVRKLCHAAKWPSEGEAE